MAYSILGKVSCNSNKYDHIINSMVLSTKANINSKQVPDKFSELAQHKNTKNNFQKVTKTEESSALLTDTNNYPYNATYECLDGKHNTKNTSHRPESCWEEHPEL
ncbi:hypothetical protein O181_061874 [Austropuccinia psidii MF-1]|uniref:Uncharacterized protein n=1 Tax=Austropuccinia psidii MF-1 TaxID=1389203 RepID=A0A9Q3I107_9BASI|nr:hypothetical protein [Austropuccinia psidii MF-1]